VGEGRAAVTGIRLDVYHHVVLADDSNPLLKLILAKLENVMAQLDDVITKVTALTTVTDGVVALLTDLKTKLDAAINAGADPAKLQALSDALGQQTQRLADAVAVNTPGE
jgi:hypothetical protein